MPKASKLLASTLKTLLLSEFVDIVTVIANVAVLIVVVVIAIQTKLSHC